MIGAATRSSVYPGGLFIQWSMFSFMRNITIVILLSQILSACFQSESRCSEAVRGVDPDQECLGWGPMEPSAWLAEKFVEFDLLGWGICDTIPGIPSALIWLCSVGGEMPQSY